jgi:hypothetical protein
MNNLEELELAKSGVVSAIIALNPGQINKQDFKNESELERAKVISPILLPKLKKIRVHDTGFHGRLIPSQLDDQLLSCLESRKRANHELGLLTLENCRDVGPNEVERYKQHVQEVDWDGVVKFRR